MFYLLITYPTSTSSFNKFPYGRIVHEDSDFDHLLENIKEFLDEKEVSQCKASINALGSYYNSNNTLSIIDKIQIETHFPELIDTIENNNYV